MLTSMILLLIASYNNYFTLFLAKSYVASQNINNLKLIRVYNNRSRVGVGSEEQDATHLFYCL